MRKLKLSFDMVTTISKGFSSPLDLDPQNNSLKNEPSQKLAVLHVPLTLYYLKEEATVRKKKAMVAKLELA